MTDTTNASREPRHMGPTREVPLVGYRPRHGADNKPRNGGRHLEADGSKVRTWPAQDPNLPVQPPAVRPYVPTPNVVVEPPMTAKDALTMRNACLYAAALVAVFGVVALIAVNMAGVS